jgi:hypothetical protein
MRSIPFRTALLVDAAASGGMGVLLLLDSAPLSSMLGLPAGLLRGAGIILVPFALMLFAIARRTHAMSSGALRTVGWTIVGGNVLWVLASVLVLVSGAVAPTLIGEVFVVTQTIAVVAFTYFEVGGVRALDAHRAVRA